MNKVKSIEKECELASNIYQDVKNIVKNSEVGLKLCLYIPKNSNRAILIDGLTAIITDYILPLHKDIKHAELIQ